MTSRRSPRWRQRRGKSTSGFSFADVSHNVQIKYNTEFRQNSSIRGWDITISDFWKQMATILKFYFRFHFDVSVVIGMWVSVSIQDFIKIGPSVAELWRHNHFQDGATASQIYFRFPFLWRTAIKNVKSICILNVDNIAQFAADILLFPFSENKWPPSGPD